MLVNFALGCLDTEVTCDKVSSDGHEPDNLLRHDTGWMQKGFLAERFIKPPVTLTFKFPCPVHLKSIVLDPKMGSQRSSFIEIYTALRHRNQKVEGTFGRQNPRLNNANQSVKRSGTEESCQEAFEPIFKKIGSIHSSEPGRICFHNPLFRGNSSSSVDSMMETCPHHVQLRHHQSVMLLAADFLAVRIVAAANSSVPAVGRIHIWGQPAQACPPAQRESIFRNFTAAVGYQTHGNGLVNDSNTQSIVGEDVPSLNSQSSHPQRIDIDTRHQNDQNSLHQSSKRSSSHAVDPSVNIPEEFLDALTFEIMSLPMLLPSGQSIDMSTLDRFSDAEANYGRQPSDPFTGLGFTAVRKPVVNMPLKLRIDRFLLEHADKPSLQSVPRAVGTSAQASQIVRTNRERVDQPGLVDSRLVCRVGNLKRKSERGLYPNDTSTSTSLTQSLQDEGVATNSPSSQTSKKVKVEREAVHNANVVSNFQKESSATSSSDSHEEQLKSSLSCSLSLVLRGLPMFTKPSDSDQQFTSSVHPPKADQHCSSCKTQLKAYNGGTFTPSTSITYMLPCQHRVCRTCVLKTGAGESVTDIICGTCKRQFAKSDVERIHDI